MDDNEKRKETDKEIYYKDLLSNKLHGGEIVYNTKEEVKLSDKNTRPEIKAARKAEYKKKYKKSIYRKNKMEELRKQIQMNDGEHVEYPTTDSPMSDLLFMQRSDAMAASSYEEEPDGTYKQSIEQNTIAKRYQGITAGFLKCPCGTQPHVLGFDDKWCACCYKCEITTTWMITIEQVRIAWNNHAKYGVINRDKNIGTRFEERRTREEINKMLRLKGTSEDLHVFFYYYDAEYMHKIRNMLKPGMTFKTYADLCIYLNENPQAFKKRNDDTIKLHKKHWKRFFEYMSSARKRNIYITKIYEEPMPYNPKDPDRPNLNRKLTSYRPVPYNAITEKEVFNYRQRIKAEQEAERQAKEELKIKRLRSLAKTHSAKGYDQYREEEEGYEIYEDEFDDLEYDISQELLPEEDMLTEEDITDKYIAELNEKLEDTEEDITDIVTNNTEEETLKNDE